MRKAKSKALQGMSVLLSLALCFSMVPFGRAYATEAEEDDAFADAADWVTNVELPASYEEIDWDSLQPGVDYEPGTLILTFMPNTSLVMAKAFIKARGWEEKETIAWDEDAKWKCMVVTVPASQSLKDAMPLAAGSGFVWYAELSHISGCPVDEEITDVPNDPIETTTPQWPYSKSDIQHSNPFEDYSERELYLEFDSGVNLDQAMDIVFSLEGWSVGSYLGGWTDDKSWHDSHELLVSIPVNMTVIEAMKIAKHQEGIINVRLVYYDTTGPVYQVDPNIAVTFDGKAASGQAEYRVFSLGWQLSGVQESIDRDWVKVEARYPESLSGDEAVREAYTLEGVTNVELVESSVSFDDEGDGNQTLSYADQWYLDYLGITDAWDYTRCEGSVSVAVLDSGVWATPDLRANFDMDNAWNAVTGSSTMGDPMHPHGTWVAGVISAEAGDGQGISGVSYNAKIVPVNVVYEVETDSAGNFRAKTTDQILTEAITHVVDSREENNVRVINISYGKLGAAAGCLQTAINYAVENDISVVCSAGNNNTDALYTPSDLDNVISVIATTTNERWVDPINQNIGSGYGSAKDIAAPGYCVKTVSPDTNKHGMSFCTGTSLSAPIVSGVLALMYAADPSLTAEEAEYYLESTATDLGEPGFDDEFANGLVNAKSAVLAVASEDALFERLAGDYVVNTMDEIVSKGFLSDTYADKTGSDTVIVATMDAYYDALTAAGLAGIKDCPILLTNPSSLTDETAQLIRELGATKAYVVGGTAAVSENVEQQIAEIPGVNEVERLWGENARYTALAIYEEGARESVWGDTAIVCTYTSFLDGLAASPYAYAKNAPIFMVNTDLVLDSESAAAIANGGFKKVIVMGGTSAVSSAIGTQLYSLVNNISRMAGSNAYETARLFADRCLQDGMGVTGTAITTAQSYYDALCAGPLCGRANAPILYANEGYTDSAKTFLTTYAPFFEKGYVLGGYSAVPVSVPRELKTAVAMAL